MPHAEEEEHNEEEEEDEDKELVLTEEGRRMEQQEVVLDARVPATAVAPSPPHAQEQVPKQEVVFVEQQKSRK